MQEKRLPKVQRPSLRETMHKPESSVPEIVAGVLMVVVIALTAIAYWPSDVRKGTAVSENSPTYRALPAEASLTNRLDDGDQRRSRALAIDNLPNRTSASRTNGGSTISSLGTLPGGACCSTTSRIMRSAARASAARARYCWRVAGDQRRGTPTLILSATSGVARVSPNKSPISGVILKPFVSSISVNTTGPMTCSCSATRGELPIFSIDPKPSIPTASPSRI